ncbi:DNA-processing protein DprA [Candidatus Parcubacteria bacterium]|nr:DNA-processing protein DprA [Candidatus Parcubacteria bacterium]
MDEKYYYLAFSELFEFIGPRRFSALLEAFGTAEAAWGGLDSKVLIRLGLDSERTSKCLAIKNSLDLETRARYLSSSGAVMIANFEEGYPTRLRTISDPPYLLYARGNLAKRDELAIAVVGSRKATSYGREVTQSLVWELARAGLTIVSGLAYGIDTLAHRAALEAGGRTIAVLASGVDNVTPRVNESLAREMVNSGRGVVLSEFPLGTSPQPFYFPIRNRLISGLSLGVLVIEAAERSGALITAGCSLDQGREVFAVPGSLFSLMSVGSHTLIKQGAKLVQTAQDVLEELDLESKKEICQAREILPESAEEGVILDALTGGELTADEIVRKSDMSSSVVNSTLTLMLMKGMVRELGNSRYGRGI